MADPSRFFEARARLGNVLGLRPAGLPRGTDSLRSEPALLSPRCARAVPIPFDGGSKGSVGHDETRVKRIGGQGCQRKLVN
jgi:hypothetical protein